MTSIVNEFENTSWKDLPESEEKGYDKKKELLKKQLAYYNKFKNKIRDHHVDFLIKDGYIHLPEYGTHIDKNDKVGIKYALSVLDNLHKNNIYHGDIFATPNIKDKEKEVTINYGNILVKDGTYKLIDFGPTKEDESRNHKQLLEDEKKLMKRYRTQQSNMARLEQHNLKLLRARKQRERKRRPLTPISPNNSPNKSPKRKEGDSPNNSPKIPRMIRKGSLRIGSLFGEGGRRRRRRTKKKRRRKRKSTKKKRRRKRKSTKKKRRRRR